MSVHIDRGISKNCKNLIDSYGEICVGCGCCSEDPHIALTSQISVEARHLQERFAFAYYDDDEELAKIQRENVKSDIRDYMKELEDLVAQLEKLVDEELNDGD